MLEVVPKLSDVLFIFCVSLWVVSISMSLNSLIFLQCLIYGLSHLVYFSLHTLCFSPTKI